MHIFHRMFAAVVYNPGVGIVPACNAAAFG